MLKKYLFIITFLLPSVSLAEGYTIDPAHTFVHFTISHMGFSNMTGRFNSVSGKMDLDFDKGTGSVEVMIDPASIDTAHQKRDNHLRSPDFLNVVEFPEIRFKSTNAKLSDNKGKLEGDLTIKGVTKPVTLDITNYNCGIQPFSKNATCGFNAITRIKRDEFNITWGLPDIVGNDVLLSIEAEGIKN